MPDLITQAHKTWIDNASYTELLSRWRFAPTGDTMFVAKTGEYYSEVMQAKKKKLSNAEQVQTSKKIGW